MSEWEMLRDQILKKIDEASDGRVSVADVFYGDEFSACSTRFIREVLWLMADEGLIETIDTKFLKRKEPKMTKRITPEMVIEAYQQHTELKPVKGVYIQVVEGGIEVCGLAAVAAMNGFDVEEYPSPVGDFLISRIGVSRDYIWGFERGFDKQGAKGQVQNTDFMVGYEDGSAAAKLVFGEPADE